MADTFRPPMPHEALEEVFDGVFFVRGSHRFAPGVVITRNMTVVRTGSELTIINSVRLDDDGERALAKLGAVKHLVRLGYFHGVDDPYYMAKYAPSFWSGERMVPANVKPELRSNLTESGPAPVDSTVFSFKQGLYDECALVLNHKDGGILVTCDSVQNWVDTRGCSLLGGLATRAMGFIGPAKLGPRWLNTMTGGDTGKLAADFRRLSALSFRHLLSGHGAPLKDHAREKLAATVAGVFADVG